MIVLLAAFAYFVASSGPADQGTAIGYFLVAFGFSLMIRPVDAPTSACTHCRSCSCKDGPG